MLRPSGGTLAPIIGFALIALAVLLPPHALARYLVGTRSPVLPDVVTGAWIFKVLLLLHGGMILVYRRFHALTGTSRADVPWLASKHEKIALLSILVVAVVTRTYHLGAGLWFDEIRTLVGYARAPFGIIVATYDSQNQHLLYSLLARASLGVFGESNAALRLPAVAFGVGSVAALYWFAVRVTSRTEALLASALLAVSYHHVWFSQNARGYTALLLATLVSSGLLLRLLSSRASARTAVAYAVVSALAVATHVTAVLVLFAHALIWLGVIARRRATANTRWLPLAAFILAGTLALQCYALVLPQFVHVLTTPSPSGTAAEWKNPAWFIAESIRGLSAGLPGGVVALTLGLAIGVTGIISYARQSRDVAAVMVLPGIVTALAVLTMEHNLWPRFFFFCAGFAVLIAIRGVFAACSVARARGPILATAVCALLIAGSAWMLPRAWHAKQDFAGARDFVERARGPRDAIVAVDLARYPYEQYLRTGWLYASNDLELRRIEETHARTWVLYTFPARLSALQPAIWERLQQSYKTAAEFPGTVGGGAIIVKVRS